METAVPSDFPHRGTDYLDGVVDTRDWENDKVKKGKPVPLHAMEALGERGDIAPTHSRPRH
jgi:hypothetical protein